MKKGNNYSIVFLFILISLLFVSKTKAQLASGIPHIFSVTAATPPAFPAAGVVNIVVPAIPATNLDEWDTLFAPAAWSINFAGTSYSKVCVSTNGWLALVPGSVPNPPWPTPQILPPNPNNQLNNNTTGYPIIAPLWDDLSCNLVSYAVVANVLWIRWNVKWNKTHASAASPLVYASLNGTTGVINFYYTNNAIYVPVAPSASIGIAGVCTGDFYSVKTTANNAATVDSVTENTTIGPTAGPAPNFRPYNCSYTFTPNFTNDNCANAKDLGTITSTCTFKTFTTAGATTSGSAICSTTDVKDVWFKFIKPAGALSVTVTTAPATCMNLGTSIEVFDACGGTSLGCSTTSVANPNYGELNLVRLCPAETLWVRVTADGDLPGKFQICAFASGAGGAGSTCATATPICSIPFSQSGLTTAGYGNEYDSLNSACHDPFMNGEDYLFAYTPPSNTCIKVSINSTGDFPGVFVFDGCPDLPGSHCIASSVNATGVCTINSVSLVAGTTYYFLIDNDTLNTFGQYSIPFDINITNVGTSQPYDLCGATNLGNVGNNYACVFSTYTTECSTPSSLAYPNPGCGNFTNTITGDIWFSFTATFTGNILIKTQPGAVNRASDIAMAVYTGNCISLTLFACDDNSAGSNMPLLSMPVITGTTYFIRLWTVAPGNTGNFDLCLSSGCTPLNDLPCTAVLVNLGGTASGYNTCAGITGEPLNSAQCVAGGIINTVWYKVIVPSSGQIKVRTHAHSLTDTQIQAFTFPTGCANAATSNVSRGCNDDGPDCGSGGAQSWHDFSQLAITGLTPGDTLYVAVDGYNSQTGTFEITFIDGTVTNFPPIQGADCEGSYDVCGTANISVADPGILGYGNICDFANNYNCWANPERNSAWYKVTVNPGVFQFDVQTFSDYDFIMWDITGLSNPCAQIQAQTLTSVRCNWVTTVGGHTGISIPDPDGSWEPAITVAGSPRTYMILIDNWNPPFQTTGYTIDWMGTPISSVASSVVWQGSIDTSFGAAVNWGTPPCNSVPNCNVDAVVSAAGSGRNPTISTNVSVKNMTINAGGILRIQSPAILDVCGNFTNFGTLIAEPGSTIRFSGSGAQTINGNLTGTNSFANLEINKPSGTVTLQANIDVFEDFTVSNSTSIFSINGKYMKVAGNFTNYNWPTFIGIGGSTVEFNGTANQNYSNTNGQDTLNRVKVNKASGKLYLTGGFSNMHIDSVLNLTLGNIVTTPTLEVNVRYGATGAIVNHSSNSYVEGRLRRKVVPFNIGTMDFPVGDPLVPNFASGNGYELANIAFTSSTVIPDLLCWFNLWPGAVPNGPGTFNNCGTYSTTYNADPVFDHGYWSFQKSVANFNGNYNVTLYNTGYTNNTGTQWTIATATLAAPPLVPGSWNLLGTCDPLSTAAITRRTLMNTPAAAANSFNHLYAVVQSTLVLPIELLYFTAEPKEEEILCSWETASETNNDYFEVERSTNGEIFEVIGFVSGFGNGVSTESRKYSFIDHDICKNIQYYRLKQVDIDGQNSYSDIVAVNCDGNKSDVNVYPNPGNSNVIVSFFEDRNGTVKFQWIDVLSKTVKEEIHDVSKGYNSIHSDISDLTKGIYYLQISVVGNNSETINRQIKFLKN